MTFLGHHDALYHTTVMVLVTEPLHMALYKVLKADSLGNPELLRGLQAMPPPRDAPAQAAQEPAPEAHLSNRLVFDRMAGRAAQGQGQDPHRPTRHMGQ